MIADPHALIDRARTTTGLSDLGADGWQEGLTRLVEAARTDLDLDTETTARLEQRIVDRLVSRLRIEDWYRNCSAEPAPVEGPVVIHGLPRTGTTALHYLLALDPRFRYQRRWEIADPVPPKGNTGDADDPRRLTLLAQASGRAGGSVQHISDFDGPMDDNMILGLDFHNQELGLPLPSYTRWWRGADLRTTYAYHERVLRLLHTGRPPYRWLVKAPYHNFHLDDLAAHYPAAKFVMTHRDPAVAVPSACSTVLTAQRNALREPPDPLAFGTFLVEHLVAGVDRAMAARNTIGEQRFLDVIQRELEDDPVATAARIYDFLGLELTPETRARMADWAAAHRRGYQGEHRYSATEYGLTPDAIRAAFAEYVRHFDVPADGR